MSAKRSNIHIEDLGDIELDPVISTKVKKMIDAADADIDEARVNFRWGKEQLDIVKRAASLIGVPYQTMIKQFVYEQSVAVLKDAGEPVHLHSKPEKKLVS
jgi:predicted DNA binding CopG/RHH family protein